MIPGVNNNGTNVATQAIVTIPFNVDNLPEQRQSNSPFTISRSSNVNAFNISQYELLAMDMNDLQPGRLSSVFSSLTGFEYDPRAGDVGLKQRIKPVGVAFGRINYNANSGLADEQISVISNGLVPLRWISEDITSPSYGDLFVAYPVSTDAATRDRQLAKASANATGARYYGDIKGDGKVPLLMKRFDGSEIDDLFYDALDMFFVNPKMYFEKVPLIDEANLSVLEMVLYKVVIGLSQMTFDTMVTDGKSAEDAARDSVTLHFHKYMTTPLTAAVKEKYIESLKADKATIEKVVKTGIQTQNALVAYKVAIQTILSSVVGRVVGNRVDGTVPVYLG